MWRSLVACALLVLPLALTVPRTIRRDVDAIREHARLSAVEAGFVPPYDYGASTNVPLLRGIRRLVPSDESVSFIPRGGPEARRIFVQTGWIRWVGFVIAPRLVDAGPGAPWVVLVHQTPTQAGIPGRRAWRFGHDWLVER